MKKDRKLPALFIIFLIILIILAVYIKLLFFATLGIILIYYVLKTIKNNKIVWGWGIIVDRDKNPFAYWMTITILIIIIFICLFATFFILSNFFSQ